MLPLNNRTTADSYTEANTLNCPGTTRFILSVSNAAIYLAYSAPGSGAGVAPGGEVFNPEVFYLPGVYALARRCSAIKVRSAAPGAPAQVTIEALGIGE